MYDPTGGKSVSWLRECKREIKRKQTIAKLDLKTSLKTRKGEIEKDAQSGRRFLYLRINTCPDTS